MHIQFRHPMLVAVVAAIVAHRAYAQDDDSFNADQRVPWTTSRIKGNPDPPAPYRTVAAFPKLKFNEPVDMASVPGSDRLFVAERFGRILSFPNDRLVEQADVVLELQEKQFHGLVLHPDFKSNGFVFVAVLVNPDDPAGNRVSRFRVEQGDPPRADPSSEQVIISWPSGGHSGGCLKFGPDGMLYIGTGDSSGIADQRLTGQDLSDLPGSILRIDVDRPAASRPYVIPPDNPFVDSDGARPEVWAYGLRQPWKFSFDRATGDLWTGNVGQDLWEQIFLIERGGNYGWSVMEGGHPFRPDRKRGPTPFIPPIVEHDHAEFRSITGGFVYHGSKLPELKGAYIYGDYDTGKIWMLRYDRGARKVTEQRELVDSALRLVGFAEDQSGELFLVDHMSGLISRLERNSAAGRSTDFPRRLSETGLFKSVADHRPERGLIPYEVIAPQWNDGASAQRFLAIPGESTIEFDGITYPQPNPGAPHGWKFPDGTVAVQTISMEMETGNPQSRRRLETRILHYEQLEGSEQVGDQFWRGYTYIWNDGQTDAELLNEPRGKDVRLSIRDATVPGGTRTQTWHFPGRSECTVCHNMAAKYVLGINTLQINRDHTHAGVTRNQLDVFKHLGLFTEALPAPPDELPRLAAYNDESQPLDDRARAYLHANCSHCHRKWGGGNADFRLLASVQLKETGIVDVRPSHGGFLIPDATILRPGEPRYSTMFYRMAKLGPGRMPRLGSNVIDESGLTLIHDWIAGMKTTQYTADTDRLTARLNGFGSRDRGRYLDNALADTVPSIELMRAVDSGALAPTVRDDVVTRGSTTASGHIRDLFERFLPEEKRSKRLGANIRSEDILALDGDVERGKQLFFVSPSTQCRNCHRIQGKGEQIGADLSEIGSKYTERAKLLDTILNPSREIDPKYRVYLVLTTKGRFVSGLLVKRDESEVVVKDAKGKQTRFSANEIDELVPQQQSMMPDLLLRDMTAQQVADLMAYLASLKKAQ